jgi:hypothetical protein
MRMGAAMFAAVGLRIIGYGLVGMAQRHQSLVMAFYLIPILGATGAIVVLAGFAPTALLSRFRVRAA